MAGVMICGRFFSPRFIYSCCRASSYFSGNYVAPKVEHISKDYENLYRKSIEEPETFWGQLAATQLNWIKPFKTVMDCDMSSGSHKWFLEGKINVTENCVDRHMRASPNRTALIWEKDEPGDVEHISYIQLYQMVNRFANAMKSQGIKKGDTVCIYMPVSPLAVAAMFACARIGAVHNVVFAGFSAEALSARINDAQCETVITADQALRGGKVIDLKKTVDTAVQMSPTVKRVFVMQRTGASVPMGDKDIPLHEAMADESPECDPEPLDSEDPLFILYTSGSTGKPKGLLHTQAGYLLYASLTHRCCFDYKPGDQYACVADVGWITGHSYVVYGPLANGATTVLFESTPTYPDPGRYWDMVERLRLNQFYGAPTAIRLLLKYGDEWVKKYDRSSLRILATVGEPINGEAWHWYNDIVGNKNCTVVDTWWQTETGGVYIAPRPAHDHSPVKPEFAMRPFFGVKPVLVDDKGNELKRNSVAGNLCFRTPTPGMARSIYGDRKRFLETYYLPYPGLYFSGDGALRDIDGHYRITGRVDDVINVSGHRIGTAEIEDAMDNHKDVAETAVVGFPHEIKGEGIYAYTTLKEGAEFVPDDLRADLRAIVKDKIGSFAIPEVIQIVPGLPKTRSGKIMRRILRKVAQNKPDELGDVSTLADPSVVEVIVRQHQELMTLLKLKGKA